MYSSILIDKEAFITGLCIQKLVLHLGCCRYPYCQESFSSGELFHLKLLKIAQECHGMDIDQPSLDFLARQGIPHLFWGDVEKLELNQWEKYYDIILAGEILEHLNNFGLFLSSIRHLMNRETLLVISVPNTPTLKGFLRALIGQEMVHHDHVCYFSATTLTTLLDRFQYRVEKVMYYCATPFQRSGHFLKLSNRVAAKLCRIFPRLADGLIVVAKLR